MSGFTRDTKHYGDRLVYEALDSKWRRYHARCRCGGHWSDHLEPAGFTVVRQGNTFVALTGPGLTEGVDEAALTTNALWEAVTGQSGAQTWFDTVQVIDRSEEAEAKRKPSEEPAQVIDRLTKDTTRTLISLLKSRQNSAASQPQEPVAADVHDA